MIAVIKAPQPPAVLTEWLDAQLPVGLNLGYADFNDKPGLRAALIAEQFGLCAYTGVGIDVRLPGATNPNHYKAHIEHLKPQSACKVELIAAGKIPGRDLGDDVAYHNLVAALEVNGSKQEQFGASVRGNTPLPVFPTDPSVEARFGFTFHGKIIGNDPDADSAIEILKLNHPTLKGWREAALEGYLDPEIVVTKEDLQAIVNAVTAPKNGQRVEFYHCIVSVANTLI